MTRGPKKGTKVSATAKLLAIKEILYSREEDEASMAGAVSLVQRRMAEAVLAERMRCLLLVRKWGDAGTDSLQTLFSKIEKGVAL